MKEDLDIGIGGTDDGGEVAVTDRLHEMPAQLHRRARLRCCALTHRLVENCALPFSPPRFHLTVLVEELVIPCLGFLEQALAGVKAVEAHAVELPLDQVTCRRRRHLRDTPLVLDRALLETSLPLAAREPA